MNRRHISFLMTFGVIASPAVVGAQRSPAGARTSLTLVSGASVSHETSGFLGGQVERRVTSRVAIFVEGGKIWDASTAGLASGADNIARATGATGSAEDHITYADAGVRLSMPLDGGFEPYISGGFGAARVRTETTFASNRTPGPPAASTTQIGTDLNGTVTKPMVTAGAGATIPFSNRVFADLSVRYSGILSKTSEIPNDHAIDVVRLQAGVGVRF